MSQKVIITGASSGIGKALAAQFYKNGFDVGIAARRKTELDKIAKDLKAQYPNKGKIISQALDVTQIELVKLNIDTLIEYLDGVDIIVVNAGITAVAPIGKGLMDEHQRVFDVNLMGAVATIDAVVEYFREQGRGHIVGVSSISAYIALPGSAAYSASKAALSNYLKAVRIELLKKNITVSMIHPGYIQTELTPNMHKKPFVITADKAAKEMYKGVLRKNKNIIVPFLPWGFLAHILGLLPDRVLYKILGVR